MNNATEQQLPTPFYIVYEDRLRRNLSLISDVARRSGAEIIMALKANALWRNFDIVREYITGATASSLNELQLIRTYLSDEVHTYTPAYTDANIDEYLDGSTHLTFNSLSQLHRYMPRLLKHSRHVSAGLRVNPECSVIDTDIYNPAIPGSRFGVKAPALPTLPEGVEGLHFHALCESSAADTAKVLAAFEQKFGHLLPQVKWVNMGGGHLMTREGYDVDLLVETIKAFRERHPHLQVILEPGSAFFWQTGDLLASVVDIVEDGGITTAILDVSFACHMPDTLEMPYQPVVTIEGEEPSSPADWQCRLGGNSCLTGDFTGPYHFPRPLRIGDRLRLHDMNHYTTVKTNMFNGVAHPDLVFKPIDGEPRVMRHYTFADYRDRMA